jgi:hypothetical protein
MKKHTKRSKKQTPKVNLPFAVPLTNKQADMLCDYSVVVADLADALNRMNSVVMEVSDTFESDTKRALKGRREIPRFLTVMHDEIKKSIQHLSRTAEMLEYHVQDAQDSIEDVARHRDVLGRHDGWKDSDKVDVTLGTIADAVNDLRKFRTSVPRSRF